MKRTSKSTKFRNTLWILLAVMLFSSAQIHIAMPSLTLQSTLSMRGSVNAVINPSTSDSFALSIIGDDYLLYTNEDPEKVWLTDDIYSFAKIEKFTKWNCSAARLAFVFPNSPTGPDGKYTHSVYYPEKMNSVLDILGSVGVKGILCDFNVQDDLYDYYGSWNWVNNWKAIALEFKGDNRVAAFQLANEPYQITWASEGPLGRINTRQKFMQVYGYLIDKIREIDPTRKIVYPTWFGMGLGYTTMQEWYNELQIYGILNKENIVYDILHPYYTENEYDMGMTPSEKVAWFKNNYIVPAVELFGSQNVWIGETFAWVGKTPLPGDQHLSTHDKQVQFLTEIINLCLDYNVNLQVWSYFGKQSWQDEALEASRYLK